MKTRALIHVFKRKLNISKVDLEILYICVENRIDSGYYKYQVSQAKNSSFKVFSL
jgi:hypothetical protein